jgi:hypothetical protein
MIVGHKLNIKLRLEWRVEALQNQRLPDLTELIEIDIYGE